MHTVRRVISGGQTGVDRAALDVARESGIEQGGWCPAGRRAEDGPIGPEYELRETASSDYRVRTAANVDEADGTLILNRGRMGRGTTLTRRLARASGKPCLAVHLDSKTGLQRARKWLAQHRICVLNVAGPRESESPGIGAAAAGWLRYLFRDPAIRGGKRRG